VTAEPDPLVWQAVFTTIHGDDSEPSIRLARAALSHESPDVRRRACEHLAAHPAPAHEPVLLPALEDPTDSVRAAAVTALVAGQSLDNPEPLERLAAHGNGRLRVQAAVALCRLGDPAGPPALDRLSHSDDPNERRWVAEAMGTVPDPSFAAALIRMLDDRPSVRQAALASLPSVAGRDVAQSAESPEPDVEHRVELWKAWQAANPPLP